MNTYVIDVSNGSKGPTVSHHLIHLSHSVRIAEKRARLNDLLAKQVSSLWVVDGTKTATLKNENWYPLCGEDIDLSKEYCKSCTQMFDEYNKECEGETHETRR